MALYQYQGFSKAGKRVHGSIDAASSADVRNSLSQQGIYVSTINLAEAADSRAWWQKLFRRQVSLKDKLFFTKQLGVLLSAGVPLVKALDLLIEQTDGALQAVVIKLRDQIKEGSSLADAMAAYPKIFENVYVQLVRAGEASGKLEAILKRLYEYLSRRAEIRKEVSSALRGPLMQLGLVLLVAGVLTTQVVPKVITVLEDFKRALPLPTYILKVTSDFLINNYLMIYGAIAVIVLGFMYWRSTPSGARTLDSLKLKLPVIKYFAKTSTVVQFSRTLGMLVESGVNLAEALTIVTNLVDNKVLADAIDQAKENIIKQGKISQFLAQTGIFPPLAIYLINTGEQSGELDTMLFTVADHYEGELKEVTSSLTAKLQPIMMVVLAVIVGFIVFSIFSPIMELTTVLS